MVGSNKSLPPSYWMITLVAAAVLMVTMGARQSMGLFVSRALLIGIYLLVPKTELTFYLFAAGLGLTWLAIVPPTAGVVGKLFGTRYLSTLFGLTLRSHQIGGFFLVRGWADLPSLNSAVTTSCGMPISAWL